MLKALTAMVGHVSLTSTSQEKAMPLQEVNRPDNELNTVVLSGTRRYNNEYLVGERGEHENRESDLKPAAPRILK